MPPVPFNLATFLLFAFVLLLPPVSPLARGQSAEFTTLYNFGMVDGNGNNAEGYPPNGGLVLGTDGNLYGTASQGGPYAKGTAFKLTPGGKLIVLQRFGNNNGASPYAGLFQARDGSFYGTTNTGGTLNKGTAFKLTASGQRTTLHNFGAANDGARPSTALIQGGDGNFYGVTQTGGVNGSGGAGTVYQMTPGGVVTILHTFAISLNGHSPVVLAPVMMGSDGNLYGVTFDQAKYEHGYFYRLTTGGTFDILYNYRNQVWDSALVEATPGVFYGTSNFGIFKITSAGKYTGVLSGGSLGMNGIGFGGALLLADDGNLYGVGAPASESSPQALLYSVKPDGSNFTILYQGFTGPDGLDPESPLVQGRNGSFYGATLEGGNGNPGSGTIFNLAVPPTITSAATATGQVGQPFSYQISGSLNPTHFGALGLFSGLKVDAKTGIVSGIPTTAGTKTLTLQATNTGGTSTGPLKLTITN